METKQVTLYEVIDYTGNVILWFSSRLTAEDAIAASGARATIRERIISIDKE